MYGRTRSNIHFDFIVQEAIAEFEGDENIHLLSNIQQVGNVQINAFQRSADVVMQKSLREGFGLTVSEGLWKGRPVVATRIGGIQEQIVDGESGLLVPAVSRASVPLGESHQVFRRLVGGATGDVLKQVVRP